MITLFFLLAIFALISLVLSLSNLGKIKELERNSKHGNRQISKLILLLKEHNISFPDDESNLHHYKKSSEELQKKLSKENGHKKPAIKSSKGAKRQYNKKPSKPKAD